MKKIFIFISVLSFILLFSNSCSNIDDPAHGRYYISTQYHTIYRGDWLQLGYGYWFIRLRNNDITQNVLNNGAILVYYKAENNTWIPFPHSSTYWNRDGVLFTEEFWCGLGIDDYNYGFVDIHYVYNDPLTPTPLMTLDIKIVTIQ